MPLKEAIADYLLYLQHEQGASVNTIRSCCPSLHRFQRWVEAQGLPVPTIGDITTPLARRYSYALSEQGLRPRSRLRLWIPLRSLFRMLVQHRALAQSPVEEIACPRKDPAVRLLAADGELAAVLEAAGQQRCRWRAVRDQAVLAVLIYTALRRHEVVGLQVEDVRLEDGSLRVRHGKSNKARTVPLCAEAQVYVARWLEVRPPVKHGYLFTTGKSRRLAENGLAALLERAKVVAGFPDAANIKPHSIRHAAATRLMHNGADLRSVMAWLGHSHLNTTAIYLHTDEQRLREIAPCASLRLPQAAQTESIEESAAPTAIPRRLRRHASEVRVCSVHGHR